MDVDLLVLRVFEVIFDGVSFKKGILLDFYVMFEGEFVMFIKGKRVSVIVDVSFCRAFFDCYVGKDLVIFELKFIVCVFVDGFN